MFGYFLRLDHLPTAVCIVFHCCSGHCLLNQYEHGAHWILDVVRWVDMTVQCVGSTLRVSYHTKNENHSTSIFRLIADVTEMQPFFLSATAVKSYERLEEYTYRVLDASTRCQVELIGVLSGIQQVPCAMCSANRWDRVVYLYSVSACTYFWLQTEQVYLFYYCTQYSYGSM